MPHDPTPIEMVVLQGTPFCNLNCTYCDLSPDSRRTKRVMGPAMIERVFTELFTCGHVAEELTVIWHSGEPLTLPPAYYDDAIEQILRLKRELVGEAISLSFDIQTNGVLIDERWCALFKRREGLLRIGISCDGPAELHDAFRTNWARNATHAKTLRGMELLRQHGIGFKVIAVVTGRTLDQPESFFAFFHERRDMLSGFHFNILAGAEAQDQDLSYGLRDRSRYYDFYRRLIDLDRDAAQGGGGLGIQNFSHGIARIMRAQEPGAPCDVEQASAPFRSLNVDAEGNVTSFYAGLAPSVLPDQYGDGKGLCLGNLMETPLPEMIRSGKLRRIMQDFSDSTEFCRRSCDYFQVCTGGFEITKKITHGRFDAGETPECAIHVKALTDALLDDIAAHLDAQESAVEAI